MRRRTLEGRLFGWMLVMALVPALGLVALGTWIWTDSLDRISSLGPWDRVGDSGRLVFEVASEAAESDTILRAALDRHREELSESLLLARRWAYLRERALGLLPAASVIFGLVLVGAAFSVARRLSRELARPIRELVQWAEILAREERLPDPLPAERLEVREVRSLRRAFRAAEVELVSARRRALEAERVRIWGEMARRVAHEMKNPLTPIRLALHRLVRSGGDEPEVRESLVVIAEEVERLEELAQRFAVLGRPLEGPVSEIDLRELLGRLIEVDLAPPVEAELVVSGRPMVEGHHEALVRAFRNLIRNAAESMEGIEGPRQIEIRVSGPGDDDSVEVKIADRGSGVPEGVESRIFEPDFTTKSRGTGLGLALVQQTVRAHGGTIDFAPREGGGVEFVIRLPVRAGSPAKNLRLEAGTSGALPIGGSAPSSSAEERSL